MSDIVKPGAGILFMKVGTHAQETLVDIFERKRREIQDTGYALWGYGGNTCHPLTMVQPFARDSIAQSGAIYLCMEPMNSKHFAVPERAVEFSRDGAKWEEIPSTISVRGSRFALAIESLDEADFSLPLAQTEVAIGMSRGKPGDRYISGRVDKGCLRVLNEPIAGEEPRDVHIGLSAKLVEPYAVLLR
jgi:hypothetical protein